MDSDGFPSMLKALGDDDKQDVSTVFYSDDLLAAPPAPPRKIELKVIVAEKAKGYGP